MPIINKIKLKGEVFMSKIIKRQSNLDNRNDAEVIGIFLKTFKSSISCFNNTLVWNSNTCNWQTNTTKKYKG